MIAIMVKALSLYLFASVLVLSYLIVFAFTRGKTSYARALGALCLSIDVYILGYLLELNTSSLKDMIFWNHIQYLGVPFYPMLWLLLSLIYTGRNRILRTFWGVLIVIEPLLTFVMHLTNNYHHLYYKEMILQQIGDVSVMLLPKGPWYYVHLLYCLIVLVVCTSVYANRYRQSEGDDQAQFRILLVATTIPFSAFLFNVFTIGGVGLDFTAFVLPPCIALFAYAVLRYNLMEMRSLARDRIFEDSETGWLLINRLNHIVDYNAASEMILKWFEVTIKDEQLMPLSGEPSHAFCDGIHKDEDTTMPCHVNGEERFIKISTRQIKQNENSVGRLITLEDVTEREHLNMELIKLANTDALSGLFNRRHFRSLAEEALVEARETNMSLCFLMLDIDHFKQINDTYGHSVGDYAVQAFSSLLRDHFEGMLCGRMGGEEFAVLLHNCAFEEVIRRADAFRDALSKQQMMHNGASVMMTVSIGVAVFDPSITKLDTLINRADHALYAAKRLGRNRTLSFTEN